MITIHDKLMMYKGNFKSSPKKRKRKNNKTKKVKNDVENELNLSKPLVVNNYEAIIGTVVCATGVKALRCSFMGLLDNFTDSHFTGRLMKIVKEIYHRDCEGLTGKKSIFFSREKAFLATLIFNIRKRDIKLISYQFECRHSESRDKATLAMSGLKISNSLIPKGATHYRVLNHLSIISDYVYTDINQLFEPLSSMNTINAIAYSKYMPVGVPLTDEIVVSLPVNDDIPDDVSVIQCVGIVYYTKSGLENFIINKSSSVMVYDVF